MGTYSYSLHGLATLVHVGYPVTACGVVFSVRHHTSDNMPAGRRLCSRCARSAGITTATRTVTCQDPRTRAVLTLLREGHADPAIARRLGVSVRTVGRIVTRLMRDAGARSRWQGGHLTAAWGGAA